MAYLQVVVHEVGPDSSTGLYQAVPAGDRYLGRYVDA